jgi:carotenoid cleavage dioxygenase
LGGPVYGMFNVLMRLDFTGQPPRALALSPDQCFNEPIHVPSSRPGHEGWLVTVVDRQVGPTEFTHAIWVLDAGNPGTGPVAKVAVPHRLRAQVHGWWVGAAELEAARL